MIWTTRQRSERGGLASIVAGDGPLVVLIHGVGLRADAWNPQIDALVPLHRVVAVDLPGHGGSAALDGEPNLARYADAVAAVIDEPALVVGHSMGAMIAVALAARHAGLVRGLAALNAIYRRDPAAQSAVHARVAALDGVARVDPSGALARWFGAEGNEANTTGVIAAARMACAVWLRGMDPAGYKAAYSVFAAEDGPADSALAALACPALFLTGRQEPNSTPAMSLGMAARAPKGEAQIIDGAAHMMLMTHAAQVNAHLLKFASRVPR